MNETHWSRSWASETENQLEDRKGEEKVGGTASEKAKRQGRMGSACGKWRTALTLGGGRTEGHAGLRAVTGSVYEALCGH